MAEDPSDRAERLERKTQRILWVSGLAFLAWQLAYLAFLPPAGTPLRNVDLVRSFGFLVWAAALLFMLGSGGGAFAGREAREILDDELARARRALAYRNAFWAMIAIGFVGYGLALLTRIPAIHLTHASLSGGVLVAVLTLAYLNRR
jgi:nitrate reductase NapE component